MEIKSYEFHRDEQFAHMRLINSQYVHSGICVEVVEDRVSFACIFAPLLSDQKQNGAAGHMGAKMRCFVALRKRVCAFLTSYLTLLV